MKVRITLEIDLDKVKDLTLEQMILLGRNAVSPAEFRQIARSNGFSEWANDRRHWPAMFGDGPLPGEKACGGKGGPV